MVRAELVDETRRLAALRRYQVLDTAAEPTFDNLAALAAAITGCPTALISLVDADRQWFKAVVDFPYRQSVRSVSMCSRTIESDEIMTVEDATADPRFADNPLVTSGPKIRFYAGAPLITPDGYRLGTICGIDYRPKQLDESQRDALRRLADQVMRELEIRRVTAELATTVLGRPAPEHPEMLQDILDGAPALVYVKDLDGRYLMANEQFFLRTSTTQDEVLGRTDVDVFGPVRGQQYHRNDVRALGSADALQVREELEGDGVVRTFSSLKFPLRDWRGRPYAVCGISSDITDLLNAEAAAQAGAERVARIVDGALDGIVAFCADGTVAAINPAAGELFGWSAAEALGRDFGELMLPPLVRVQTATALRAYLRGESTSLVGERIEVLGQRRDGSTFPLELAVLDVGSDPGRFIAFIRDLSDLRYWEEQLRTMAESDALTGLANRLTFLRALHHGVTGPTGSGAVLLIDLDSFKHINDTFGHRTGDDCLRHVAAVMRERTRDHDMLARLGGDEFALLLPRTSVADARSVAEGLLERLRTSPLVVDGRPVRMTASIGIAPLSLGVPSEEVLHTADAAMYEAKQAGRDRIAVFSDVAAAARRSAEHVGQAHELRNALAEDRFLVYAQPIVEARTGLATSHELLVRMVSPSGEVVLPAAFLPAAERFDLVQRIDLWMVGRAVGLLQRAAHLGRPAPRLSINLSGRSLSDRVALDGVERIVSGVDPSRLVFEITETAAVTHLGTATAFMLRLAEMGFEVCLDDFGAGYASFHYLKHLPVQSVKIDGEFVRGILTDRLDRAVVRATLSLAEDMGYRTIAESVESAELLDELCRYGVDDVQGYHLGRPGPAAEVLGLDVQR